MIAHDQDTDFPIEAMRALTKRKVISTALLGNGRNSRVYRAVLDDGVMYAVKVYSDETAEGHSRLLREFSSLRFLWDNGVRAVPEPVFMDEKNRFAVLGLVDGAKIRSDEASREDIGVCLSFLGELKRLAESGAGENIGPAAEACFSAAGVTENVSGRLERLSAVPIDDRAGESFREFIERDFRPALLEISNWSLGQIRRAGLSPDKELDQEEMTLSPSDFAFHNALRKEDGEIVFFDFEYFGWDDPAKAVSDFLLHPAMNLTGPDKRYFTDGAAGLFGGGEFMKRLKAFYPLFGLKWIMILLNEFLPAFAEKRGYGPENRVALETLRERQLSKAVNMFKKVTENYSHFPHGPAEDAG